MIKIPVGATIAHAFRFAFGQFFRVFGIMWLPWLILSAVGFLLMRQAMTLSTAIATHDGARIAQVLPLLVPFYLVVFVFMFMQIAGITELALGLNKGSPYYYFSLGKPVWRLIGAILLVVLIIIGLYLLLVIGGILLGIVAVFLAKLANPPAIVTGIVGLAAVIASIGCFCAYIYALVRLTFLLTPVVIAEQRISLKRSWALGRGNFWRMFAILLSVLIPAIGLEMIFMFGFLFHGLPPSVPLHATPDQVTAFQASMAAWNANVMSRMMGNWYITYPLFAIFTILFYGLSAGAQAFAYRARIADETQSLP